MTHVNDLGCGRIAPVLCVILGAVACGAVAMAERPRIYAVTDVRIVTGPGQVIENGALVLRDGLIEAVGTDVAVPADAQAIAGEKNWTVYPAFIDAASSVGLPSEPDRPPPNARAERSPPKALGSRHEVKAVRPEEAVVDRLDTSHDSIERHRELGFAIAQVLPQKGVFRGESALVLLRAGPTHELILRDRYSQVVALEAGSFMARQYPSSRIGAIATVRQAFLDAARHGEWQARYAADPVGMQHPEYRSSDAALLDVLAGQRPVVFVADAGLDPGRFRALANEFELRAITVARGLADRADDLQMAGMPVLLPLELPDKLDLDEEDALLETDLRQMQTALLAPRLPASLAQADIDFAFVTAGMKSVRKFTENLAATVAAGLAPEQALAALTTTPAALLGLSQVAGTITPGKQANLMIVEGELFVAKPAIQHFFVDGYHEEIEPEETIGDPDAVVDPRGTWEIVSEVMGRTAESKWTISGSADNYRGFSESARAGKRDFASVELKGNALTVISSTPRGELEITVVVSADTLSGETTMESERGSVKMSVEGRRIAGPEETEQ